MKNNIIIIAGDPNSINSEIIYKSWKKINCIHSNINVKPPDPAVECQTLSVGYDRDHDMHQLFF